LNGSFQVADTSMVTVLPLLASLKVMLTGSADRDLVQNAAASGVNNYIVKPFAPAALKDKIERVFGELT
jgi:AmiR/NasT family two-component response regulator